jgi:hypothetical protein
MRRSVSVKDQLKTRSLAMTTTRQAYDLEMLDEVDFAEKRFWKI